VEQLLEHDLTPRPGPFETRFRRGKAYLSVGVHTDPGSKLALSRDCTTRYFCLMGFRSGTIGGLLL
jgi:hypothetical protein